MGASQDVRKALQLLRISNVSLLEWTANPIEYRRHQDLFDIFHSVVPHGFQQYASARHYLSMAEAKIAKTNQDHVRTKSYLYAIRPLLCCRWVLERNSQPPVTFRDLVVEYLAETPVGNAISTLITTKEKQTEIDTISKDQMLNDFLSDEFQRLTAICPQNQALPEVALFDDTFRRIIALA